MIIGNLSLLQGQAISVSFIASRPKKTLLLSQVFDSIEIGVESNGSHAREIRTRACRRNRRGVLRIHTAQHTRPASPHTGMDATAPSYDHKQWDGHCVGHVREPVRRLCDSRRRHPWYLFSLFCSSIKINPNPTTGLSNAVGSIFVSRLSTSLHAAAVALSNPSASATVRKDHQPSPRLMMLTLPVEIILLLRHKDILCKQGRTK